MVAPKLRCLGLRLPLVATSSGVGRGGRLGGTGGGWKERRKRKQEGRKGRRRRSMTMMVYLHEGDGTNRKTHASSKACQVVTADPTTCQEKERTGTCQFPRSPPRPLVWPEEWSLLSTAASTHGTRTLTVTAFSCRAATKSGCRATLTIRTASGYKFLFFKHRYLYTYEDSHLSTHAYTFYLYEHLRKTDPT
jgi:hypothetical protein